MKTYGVKDNGYRTHQATSSSPEHLSREQGGSHPLSEKLLYLYCTSSPKATLENKNFLLLKLYITKTMKAISCNFMQFNIWIQLCLNREDTMTQTDAEGSQHSLVNFRNTGFHFPGIMIQTFKNSFQASSQSSGL